MILKKAIYLRLFMASILGALALSLVSLFCLVQISDMVVEDYRYGYLMYIGRHIEKSSQKQPVSKINLNKYPAPPLPDKETTLSILKISELAAPMAPRPEVPPKKLLKNIPSESKLSPRPALWLVSNTGRIISGNTGLPLPDEWISLPLPKKIYGMESTRNMLWEPKTFIMKLNTEPVTYLVTHNERSLFHGPYLWIQGLHTFTTAALAVFIALSICFYYLRRKSMEARQVLAKLEAGDLKSRFEIKRFDQFGNLILDFNRMADEIERLVKRLNNTETSRSNLLQELGHDLRTPLTSLGTSFEALKNHHDQLNIEDREELFLMIDSDIRYFKELLEKLTIIATIDESHYKTSSEQIELTCLLESEVKSRQLLSNKNLNWNLTHSGSHDFKILGDHHLINRLFKNAFDNAIRFARKRINIELVSKKDSLEVIIADDGPGLTQEALISFGKRREQRLMIDQQTRNFSLGLGSVIMRTIAEVHDGTIIMSNASSGGAILKVIFKK